MTDTPSTDMRWNELLRVTRAWRLEWNMGHLMSRVAREAVELLGLERASIFLLETGGLVERASAPELDRDSARRGLRLSRSVAQQVVQSGRSVFAHTLAQKSDAGPMRTVFCVPLTASRGILGALYADSSNLTRKLDKKDEEFLEMLALQAAAALEHAQLYQSAITDPLTGLYSHRHFQQEVDQAVRRSTRSGQALTLAIIDLDHFKELNDTCGHEAGNECLRAVAAILRSNLRSTDVIARFGGDEYELLLTDAAAAPARDVCEKIRQKIEALVLPQNKKVTGTIGLAGYPLNAADAQTLFLRADEALYEAKEAGRNRIATSQFRVSTEKAQSGEQQRGAAPVLNADGSNGAVALPILSPINSPIVAGSGRAHPAPLHAAVEQIDGHAVIRRLGTGSSGEVLLVRQPDLQREVALKRPLSRHLTAAQSKAFEREARVTAALSFPGVVTVHTMGQDADGRRYYTMKPVSGFMLSEILEGLRRGELKFTREFTQNRLLEILQRAAETIAHAHSQNIAHLDLTPSNIIVGNFGEVTVIDWAQGATQSSFFGRSRGSGKAGKGRAKLVLGSPAYLSPEQASGAGMMTPGADVYALGAMLYEILTQRTPFQTNDTQQTLTAILQGELRPPETAAPEAGVDPYLSTLCMDALNRDPSKRPTAAQLTDRLGRYVRNEQGWISTHFGANTHPLLLNEWDTIEGGWRLSGGEFISTGSDGNVMSWKTPITGSFRFVCEGWSETNGEISLAGRQPGRHTPNFDKYGGYFFQIGAEGNICTKFCRKYADVMTIPDIRVRPRQRYRVEMQYQDGWVRCFLDGRKVFSYRELFPFSGQHIGIVTWGPGVHMRPIEVQWDEPGLQISLPQLADQLFERSRYDDALERYREVAAAIPTRLEGLEAKLKTGVCLVKLGRDAEARTIFHSLAGTQLEPFALAEEGALDIRWKRDDENHTRGVKLFRRVVDKFPGSPASIRIHDMLSWHGINNDLNFTKFFTTRGALCSLGARTADPPGHTQIASGIESARADCLLGRWKMALQTTRRMKGRLREHQYRSWDFENAHVEIALANGREDQLPESAFALHWWGLHTWHLAIRRDGAKPFLKKLVKLQARLPHHQHYVALTKLMVLLAAGEQAGAVKCLRTEFEPLLPGIGDIARVCFFEMIGDSGNVELMDSLLGKNKLLHNQHGVAAKARICLGLRQLHESARLFKDLQIPRIVHQDRDLATMQAMLASLGLLPKSKLREIKAGYRQFSGGIYQNMIEIFLGLRAPKPGKLWPHHLWMPRWRLWLAIWLAEKGKRKEALALAESIRDPRYGPTHSQSGIEAFIMSVR